MVTYVANRSNPWRSRISPSWGRLNGDEEMRGRYTLLHSRREDTTGELGGVIQRRDFVELGISNTKFGRRQSSAKPCRTKGMYPPASPS